MIRVRLLLLLLLCTTASALHAQPFYPFTRTEDSLEAIAVVQRYVALQPGTRLDNAEVAAMTTGEFASDITSKQGLIASLFQRFRPTILGAMAIRPDDSLVLVTTTMEIDSVPYAGVVMLDPVFFVRRTDEGMRIEGYDHQRRITNAIAQLHLVDTSREYPPSIRPLISREIGALLLSNAQLRAHLNEHRAEFAQLAEMFAGDRKLKLLAREDHTPTQINNVGIYWGAAAQIVPQSAIDEYMRTATKEQQRALRAQIAAVDQQRKIGEDTLRSVIARQKLTPQRVSAAIDLMHTLRIQFVNADLPADGVVQFTVAGREGLALGYIYSPSGALPRISRDEYIYLEELGGGWWIFRSIA